MVNLYEALKSYLDFSKQLTCKDLLFTHYDCPQVNGKEQFYIECNCIIYVLSGRRIFHKAGKSWEMKEGVCGFVKKGTHVSEKKLDEGWCVMSFFMPDAFLKQLLADNRSSLLPATPSHADADHVLTLDVNEWSRSFFSSMLPYFLQAPPPPESLLELKFKELVLSLLTNRKNAHFLSWLYRLIHEQHPSIEEVMQNNYTFNLTLPEYAKLACKSVPTFHRAFKKIFKDTPAKWVIKKRLTLASELLQHSLMSIGEISFECGFENQTHFSRVFKEKTGLSPLQFRTSHQTA